MINLYSDKLDPDDQITAEESIASIIFDYTSGLIEEEDCAELGRKILREVLREFRPELIRNRYLRRTGEK